MSENLKKRIRELEAEVEKLKGLACVDELTNLYNRRGFKEESDKYIREVLGSREHQNRASVLIKNFAIVIFDIDNFKNINDTYGHDCGDIVIRELAKLIKDRVREIDLVARWGGEEMMVSLIGASEKDACVVANDIREKISDEEFEYGDKKFKVTISGGVASFENEDDFEAIFKNADQALYKAKKTGKNKIVKHNELA